MADLEDVDSNVPKKLLTEDQKKAKVIIKQVEDKYQEKKLFLIRGYERAKTEEKVHYKQKDYRKYEKLFENYAYPINHLLFDEKDKENVLRAISEGSEQQVKL